MKRLLALLFTVIVLLASCSKAAEQDVATPIPPPPTEIRAESGGLTAMPPIAPAEPPSAVTENTDQPAAIATIASEAPVAAKTVDAPTPAPAATEAPPIAAATGTSPVEVTVNTAEAPPIYEPAPEAIANGLFNPGQRINASLATDEATAFLVEGRAYQPYIMFVEPSNELNVALAAYIGDQTGQTTPEGVTPPVTADNALAGRPEILVYNPQEAGLFTLVVRAVAGEGSFIAHLFDLVTPARGVAVQETGALPAGTEEVYLVTSNGQRPIIVAADPTDQSDIALDVLSEDGTLLTTANYSGPGGVETAYVLPLGPTTYLVKIRETNGGESAYQILIIALD